MSMENGRYALHYLKREMGMAGFYGGILRGSRIHIDDALADPNEHACYDYMFRAADNITFVNDVSGSDSFIDSGMPVGTGGDDCIHDGEVVAGSDVLVLRRVKDTASVKQGVTTPGTSIDDNLVYLKIQDFNVLAELSNGLSSAASNMDLWEYVPQILYVRDHAITAGDGLPSLCRRLISRTSEAMAPEQCLVQGVEQMHLEFGLDTDGDKGVDTYSADPDELALATALTTRIYLLLRSTSEVGRYSNNKRFSLGQKSVAARNDSHYRRVLQSTVSLRNSDALGP